MTRRGDGEVFFPQFVTLESGELVELPVFSLVREHRVRRHMVRAFDSLPGEMQDTLAKNFFSPRVLMRLFTRCPGLWMAIGVEVFGRSETWLHENVTMAMIFEEAFVRLSPEKVDRTQARPNRPGEGWSTDRMIEFLLHEYGWTAADTVAHSRKQIDAIMAACSERYDEQNKASSGKSTSRYAGHPKGGAAKPAESAGLGKDGGLSSVRAFAAHNKVAIKKG